MAFARRTCTSRSIFLHVRPVGEIEEHVAKAMSIRPCLQIPTYVVSFSANVYL